MVLQPVAGSAGTRARGVSILFEVKWFYNPPVGSGSSAVLGVSILFEVKWFYNVEPAHAVGEIVLVSILFEVKWFYNNLYLMTNVTHSAFQSSSRLSGFTTRSPC